jgi:hypothetical protein
MMTTPLAAHSAAPSLVGGSKSSTLGKWAYLGGIYKSEYQQALLDERHRENADFIARMEAETLERDQGPNVERAGRFVKLSSEPWRAIERDKDSGAPYTPLEPENARWVATLYTETSERKEPPRQFGDRWTEKLSGRAQKAIEYSAKYMWRLGKGYRTFLTLTFDDDARAEIALHDRVGAFVRPHANYHGPYIPPEQRKTIGRRATEFINALQQRYRNGKMFAEHYRRAEKQKYGGGYYAKGTHFKGRIESAGKSARWTPIKWREGFRFRAHHQPFQFIWVIENPENDAGECNSHIHVLMNWGVKLNEFHAWAQWVEATWGKGFAKLEKIRKPAAAANYMAKAANYIAKGADGSQGLVRGNRYSVAREARPPAARQLGKYFADWLADAVKIGQEAEREHIPKGLWFHKWGFGADTRAAWGKIWQTLKADGWRWRKAGPPLLVARVETVFSEFVETVGHWVKPKPAEYWESLLSGDVPVWAY